ncbi:Secondary metabolism regulator laeA [Colletotrichum tropicale]|nr:Secondary metabolism regulator laeA [Colletotrichum tropicale]
MAETLEKHIGSPAGSKPAETSATQAILSSVDASSISVGAVQYAPLEADEGETGNDATSIDDRISSYTSSLTSSVVDYPMEYGRRYHAFRPGSYVLPNDETESDRLDMAHALITRVIGNKLYLAPVETPKVHRILDIGTGTGIWAIEASDFFPNAEIIGNDLSAIQPLCNLNPGGWAEFQDMSVEYYSDDGSYKPEHSTYRWNQTFVQKLQSIGRDPAPGPQLESWVKEHGGFNRVAIRNSRSLSVLGQRGSIIRTWDS